MSPSTAVSCCRITRIWDVAVILISIKCSFQCGFIIFTTRDSSIPQGGFCIIKFTGPGASLSAAFSLTVDVCFMYQPTCPGLYVSRYVVYTSLSKSDRLLFLLSVTLHMWGHLYVWGVHLIETRLLPASYEKTLLN